MCRYQKTVFRFVDNLPSPVRHHTKQNICKPNYVFLQCDAQAWINFLQIMHGVSGLFQFFFFLFFLFFLFFCFFFLILKHFALFLIVSNWFDLIYKEVISFPQKNATVFFFFLTLGIDITTESAITFEIKFLKNSENSKDVLKLRDACHIGSVRFLIQIVPYNDIKTLSDRKFEQYLNVYHYDYQTTFFYKYIVTFYDTEFKFLEPQISMHFRNAKYHAFIENFRKIVCLVTFWFPLFVFPLACLLLSYFVVLSLLFFWIFFLTMQMYSARKERQNVTLHTLKKLKLFQTQTL